MKSTIEMAREAEIIDFRDDHSAPHIKAVLESLKEFETLARADEREQCAKVCEEREEQWRKAGFLKDVHEFREMAFAIRARGNP